MMKSYLEFAESSRILVITFIVTAVMLFGLFPYLPINGIMLDLLPEYSYEQVISALGGYGSDGRMNYIIASLTLDTLFPFVYVTFFAGLMYRCRVTEGLWWLALLPAVVGVIDLMENVQIVAMLAQYPEVGRTQVEIASMFTYGKHNLGYVYQFVAVVLVLITLVRFTIKNLNKSTD